MKGLLRQFRWKLAMLWRKLYYSTVFRVSAFSFFAVTVGVLVNIKSLIPETIPEGEAGILAQRFVPGGDLNSYTKKVPRTCDKRSIPEYARDFPLKFGYVRWTGCIHYGKDLVHEEQEVEVIALMVTDPSDNSGYVIWEVWVDRFKSEYESIVVSKEILGKMLSRSFLMANKERFPGSYDDVSATLEEGLAVLALYPLEQYALDLDYPSYDPAFEGRHVRWNGTTMPGCLHILAVKAMSESGVIVPNVEGMEEFIEEYGCVYSGFLQ